MPATRAPEPLALTPAMHHILLALLQGERHGYAIMQEVEKLSDSAMRLGPGTLYTSIRKMLDAGLIEESAQRQSEGDDERRRYYRIATAGRAAVLAETQRLSQLVRFANRHAYEVLA
jgi:DNA-binding PadR family transcriptional regulator